MLSSETEELLQKKFYGHLGCASAKEIYVVPITYVYVNGTVYGYTHEGKKMELIRANPRVCLQVEEVQSGHKWKSAICNGTCTAVSDPSEIQKARLLMAEKFAKIREHEVYDPYFLLIEELNMHSEKEPASILYKIQLEEVTGKKEE